MKQEKIDWKKILLCLGCGGLIGAVNGFFGGGGGMICVPLLMLLGLDEKKSHATAILVMLPISIASAIIYYSHGFLDFNVAIFVSIGAIIGSLLGAFFLKKISSKALSYVFSVIMIIAGIKMII